MFGWKFQDKANKNPPEFFISYFTFLRKFIILMLSKYLFCYDISLLSRLEIIGLKKARIP